MVPHVPHRMEPCQDLHITRNTWHHVRRKGDGDSVHSRHDEYSFYDENEDSVHDASSARPNSSHPSKNLPITPYSCLHTTLSSITSPRRRLKTSIPYADRAKGSPPPGEVQRRLMSILLASSPTRLLNFNMYQPVSSRVLSYAIPQGYDTCTFVQRLARLIHRPPHVVANAVVLFVGSTLLLNPGGCAPVLSQLLTFVPGVWDTLKCIDAPDRRKWLDYWVIYSWCVAVESCFGELIGTLFPLWWVAKVAGLYWMLGKDAHPKRKPEPLTLERKPVAHRPPTPIALDVPRQQHEPLPISAVKQPDKALRVPRIGISPVPRIPSGLFSVTEQSPPFELSPDDSSPPKGDFYFDDLATAVEPVHSDDNMIYITSARSGGTPAQSPQGYGGHVELEPNQPKHLRVAAQISPDFSDQQADPEAEHVGQFASRRLVGGERHAQLQPNRPKHPHVAVPPEFGRHAQSKSTIQIAQTPPSAQGQPDRHQLQVTSNLDASLDDLLNLAAKEDEEMMRTGDEEEVAKGSTKPLSLFERRVRRHGSVVTGDDQ